MLKTIGSKTITEDERGKSPVEADDGEGQQHRLQCHKFSLTEDDGVDSDDVWL